jgi:hypothetical protein
MQSFDEMPKPVLTRFPAKAEPAPSLHDRVQIALAIADEALLKSILTDCLPRLSAPQAMGTISATVGIPLPTGAPAYGMITFEKVCCVLSRSADELEQHLNQMGDRLHHRFERLTRYETETQTLAHGVSLTEALTILAQAGFTPSQIEAILTLPYDACHKSWWYTLNADGQVVMPFHRTLRTRHLADGTFILQYKDHFAQERPPCFQSQPVSVLVEIQTPNDTFGSTIARINLERQALGVQHVILIGDRLSGLEIKGYTHQGISLLAAHELRLPVEAHCDRCATYDCPMRSFAHSPVQTCYQFCPSESDHPSNPL